MNFPSRYLRAFLVLFPLGVVPALADTDPNVEAYSMPADAVKIKVTRYTRFGEETFICVKPGTQVQPGYFVTGLPDDKVYNSAYGLETYFKGVLIQRQLLRKGLLYGIQRQWYDDGQLRAERPYKEGLLDGIARDWNQKGQLIGQNEFKAGIGTLRIYFDNGSLKQEQQFLSPEELGLTVTAFPSGQLESVTGYHPNQPDAADFSFTSDGQLSALYLANGPSILFPSPLEKQTAHAQSWQLAGREVTEKEYAAAAAKNPQLPPYFPQALAYKSWFSAKIKAFVAKYQALPVVQIPLKFDKKGQPLLRGVTKLPLSKASASLTKKHP